MKKLLLAALAGAVTATATSVPVDFDKITHWTGTGPNRAALVVTNDAGASDPKAYVWGFRWENDATPTGNDMFRAICANTDELVLLTQITGQYGSTVCGIGFGNAEKLLENIYFDFDKAKASEFINFDYYNASSFFGQKEAPGDDTPQICQAAIDEARLTGSHYIQHPIDQPAYGYPAYDYDCWLLRDAGYDHGWWNAAWYEGFWSYWTAASTNAEWMFSGTGFTGRQLSDGCVDAWVFNMFDTPQAGGMGESNPPTDNPALYNYRTCDQATGIGTVPTDDETPATYRNLSGTQVAPANLIPGIYLKTQGGKTAKIIIR